MTCLSWAGWEVKISLHEHNSLPSHHTLPWWIASSWQGQVVDAWDKKITWWTGIDWDWRNKGLVMRGVLREGHTNWNQTRRNVGSMGILWIVQWCELWKGLRKCMAIGICESAVAGKGELVTRGMEMRVSKQLQIWN